MRIYKHLVSFKPCTLYTLTLSLASVWIHGVHVYILQYQNNPIHSKKPKACTDNQLFTQTSFHPLSQADKRIYMQMCQVLIYQYFHVQDLLDKTAIKNMGLIIQKNPPHSNESETNSFTNQRLLILSLMYIYLYKKLSLHHKRMCQSYLGCFPHQ